MIVIDVNAALEMAFESKRGEAIRALILQGEELIAPELFHAELSNACFKYAAFGSLPEKSACIALERSEALVDRFYDDSSLAKEAFREAVRYGHPAYDMFYLVLARRTGATFFTLDKRMRALAQEMHVNCIEEVELV